MKKAFLLSLFSVFIYCKKTEGSKEKITNSISKKEEVVITISKNVPIKKYFEFMDSIISNHNNKNNYKIDEYILVHHNRWIIDTLRNTDYYY